MKLLIVDDEPDAILLFEYHLEAYTSEGAFALIFSADGIEALDYLKHCPPDDLPLIALVDINMPGMDGLTLLGHMMEMYPFIRVIMVTAYGDMKNIRAAMNFGAFDFLTKPIDFHDLQMTINKAMYWITGERAQEQEKQIIYRKYWKSWRVIDILLKFIGYLGNQLYDLMDSSHSSTSLDAALKRCERLTILQAIARNEGNLTRAAEELEVTRQHLHRKLKKYEHV